MKRKTEGMTEGENIIVVFFEMINNGQWIKQIRRWIDQTSAKVRACRLRLCKYIVIAFKI